MKRLLLAAVAALALNGLGSTYYVDYVNGKDDAEHGGAEGSDAWKTITYALGQVKDDDTIFLCTGTHTWAGGVKLEKRVAIVGLDREQTQVNAPGGVNLTVSADGAVLSSFRFDGKSQSKISVTGNATLTNLVLTGMMRSNEASTDFQKGLITHCVVSNSPFAGNNWGFIRLNGSVRMENTLVTGVAGNSSIVEMKNASARMCNCTIAGNTLNGSSCAVLATTAGTVCNNIIWNNSNAAGTANWSGTAMSNWRSNCTFPAVGSADSGNISSDPFLLADGLHFASFSPCCGAANPADAPAFDFDGTPRGDNPSIGAYEYVDLGGVEVGATADAEFVYQPNGIELTAQVAGGTEPYTYAWDFNGDGRVDATTAVATNFAVGVGKPCLTVTDANNKSGSYVFSTQLAIHATGKGTYFVDYAAGSDMNDGLTPATAWKSLAYALGASLVIEGDEIVLEKGKHNFSGTLTVDRALTIHGTGAPTETTLQGGSRFVVSAAGALVHSLGLVSISVGKTSSVELSGNSTISNVVISKVGGSEDKACGLAQSAGLLTHVAVTNCTSIPFMYNGLVFMSGTATMEDCVVADNVISKAAAVTVNGANVTIRNCTIVRNTVQVPGNFAVNMSAAGNVHNTIIWGNSDTSTTANWTGNTTKWDTNCTYPLTGVADPNTIGDDPSFQSDGLHPKFSSPCNHKGNPERATTTDIEGNLRGDKPSIGAYEYVDRGELEVSAAASASFVRAPNSITLTPTIVGSYVGQLSYAWDLNGDGDPDETTPTVTLSEVGSYQPTLVVHDEGSGQGSYTFGSPLVVHAAGEGTYYVDYLAGSDSNNGLTDQTPWKKLAYAVSSPLVVSNDVIVLAKGNHGFSGTLTINKAVTIRGTGVPTETVFGNGDKLLISADGALIHSLSLVNIHKGGDDSVSLMGNSVISNAVISNVGGSNDPACGVGLSDGLLTHTVITNCPAVQFMYKGLVSLRGKAKMENCLVVGNTIEKAGAVNIRDSNVIVRNCTVADNKMKTAGAAAMIMYSGGTVANTITWGNTDISSGSVTADWGGTGSTTKWTANCTSVTNGLSGVKNLEADPCFSAKEPYHIARTSPCRNKGDDTLVAPGETDLDGNPRKKGRHVDIGCYEVDGPGMTVTVR